MSVKPVWPPPPALLTIWTGVPNSFSMKGAITRAATSLVPPAAHATTMLMGRLGFQAAAGAAAGAVAWTAGAAWAVVGWAAGAAAFVGSAAFAGACVGAAVGACEQAARTIVRIP